MGARRSLPLSRGEHTVRPDRRNFGRPVIPFTASVVMLNVTPTSQQSGVRPAALGLEDAEESGRSAQPVAR